LENYPFRKEKLDTKPAVSARTYRNSHSSTKKWKIRRRFHLAMENISRGSHRTYSWNN